MSFKKGSKLELHWKFLQINYETKVIKEVKIKDKNKYLAAISEFLSEYDITRQCIPLCKNIGEWISELFLLVFCTILNTSDVLEMQPGFYWIS